MTRAIITMQKGFQAIKSKIKNLKYKSLRIKFNNTHPDYLHNFTQKNTDTTN